MSSLAATAGIGALAGGGATVVMTAFMLAAQRAGAMSKLPPRQITEASLDAAGVGPRAGEAATKALTGATHVGFGAAAGALFALLHRRLELRAPAIVQGIVYATGVWTVSYMGWVPALRIMPPAHRDEPGRPEAMVVAHWIYGAVLGALVATAARHRRA